MSAYDMNALDNADFSTALPMGTIFSKQNMVEAITQLSKFLDPKPSASDKIPFDYTRFIILNKLKDEFVQELLLNGAVTSSEMMLLVVESITRSGEGIKRAVFRFDKENKMSGGKVIFIKWLDYVINRIDERYRAGDIPGEDEARVEEMIAESIIELICSFTVIHKEKQLNVLTTKFGVDWVSLVQKTMEFALLHKIDSIVESCKRAEAHLKNIKEGNVQPYEPRPLPEKLTGRAKERLLSKKKQVVEIIADDESIEKNGDVSLENHNQTASKSNAEVLGYWDNTEQVSTVIETTRVVDDFWSNGHQTAYTSSQGWAGSTAGASTAEPWSDPSSKINSGGWDSFTPSTISGGNEHSKESTSSGGRDTYTPSTNSGDNEQDVVTRQNVISKQSASSGGWDTYTPSTISGGIEQDVGTRQNVISKQSASLGGWDTYTPSTNSGGIEQDVVTRQNVISKQSASSLVFATGGWDNYTLDTHANNDNDRKIPIDSSEVGECISDKSMIVNGSKAATNGSLNKEQLVDVSSWGTNSHSLSHRSGDNDKRSTHGEESSVGKKGRKRNFGNHNSGGEGQQKRTRTNYDVDRTRNQGRGIEKTRPAWMTKEQFGPNQSNSDDTSKTVVRGRGRGRGREYTLPAWKTKQDQIGSTVSAQNFASFDNEGTERLNGLATEESVGFQSFDDKSTKQNGNDESCRSYLQEWPSKQKKQDSNPISEYPGLHQTQIPKSSIKNNAASQVPLGRGRGRGRTLPAWMTSEQSGNTSTAAESIKECYNSYSNNSSQPLPQSGTGPISGRGRGRDQTLPAWMTKKNL